LKWVRRGHRAQIFASIDIERGRHEGALLGRISFLRQWR
jgi:hypothetical protein